ncbi:hypothetical protein [Vibrio sp. TBV020]|uniref:hypothetical protein n=1 Tax=Vibrio sp. TBV020 TaxID=3137398 RepID=UPI0038CD8BA0
MNWKKLEEIKEKRVNDARKKLTIRKSAYQKSVNELNQQKKVHEDLNNIHYKIMNSPFDQAVSITTLELNRWQQKITIVRSKILASDHILSELKKKSADCLSQWEEAELFYQLSLSKLQKCIEVRKKNDSNTSSETDDKYDENKSRF